ncbi:MAG: hypothetical protein MJZ26_09225 [Fibrobacter sp.]|nr:hypothetical protein [Fibrobacter sp.]
MKKATFYKNGEKSGELTMTAIEAESFYKILATEHPDMIVGKSRTPGSRCYQYRASGNRMRVVVE